MYLSTCTTTLWYTYVLGHVCSFTGQANLSWLYRNVSIAKGVIVRYVLAEDIDLRTGICKDSRVFQVVLVSIGCAMYDSTHQSRHFQLVSFFGITCQVDRRFAKSTSLKPSWAGKMSMFRCFHGLSHPQEQSSFNEGVNYVIAINSVTDASFLPFCDPP